ncbi:hypothetical protein F511_24203 [Dorcoceras hygrometricum]|uniref:Electron transporter n=1 Tax=Dorcoceras hygrometricum TaxID=472368 RepID=A0A2Z7CRP9_9LAMI|nr:hypothetical protein F511_24203 [Dorcoceras hygrometricum]
MEVIALFTAERAREFIYLVRLASHLMGFEGFRNSMFPALVRHRRSNSFPLSREPEEDNSEQSHQQKLDTGHLNGCFSSNTNHLSKSEIQDSLSQEILQLEKRLQDQVSVRCAMEKALGYKASSHYVNESAIPKSAAELIKEIAVLELEVEHLEHHLLSLYRKAFDPQFSSLSPSMKYEVKSQLPTSRRRRLDFPRADTMSAKEKLTPESNAHSLAKEISENNLLDSAVQRSHSSLSQRTVPSTKTSLRICHSQPLSMMEYSQNMSSSVISLAEHLGARISDHLPETPNKLSEDMVRCMCNIYHKLADPSLVHHSHLSPTSSLSSVGAFSPKFLTDLWSPGFRNDFSFDVRLDNPFHTEGLKDFSGPYSTMVEVNCIYRSREKLNDIEYLLRDFRSLISRLEEIDPGKMTQEEKLAFWINVHNALAFLAYGIPENNMKRMFLLMKAAYNVGGQIVSADVIQNSILGCRMSHPGQWLRLLFSSRTKFKSSDARQTYALARSEPLLHFALSAGSHSDPAVRTYRPKRIYHQLDAAKEEYIRATFGVRKDNKIVLPKIMDYFAKESGLCTGDLVQMIQKSLPESLRKTIKRRSKHAQSSRKNIEWVPHNFSFRYLILKELVK